MSGIQTLTIFFTFLLSSILSGNNELEKYQKDIFRDGYVFFNSKDFKNDEEMYFKITADWFAVDQIDYIYLDDIRDFDTNNNFYYHQRSEKTENKTDANGYVMSQTKYYVITKKKSEIGILTGDYLLIMFYCDGDAEIENTKENEGRVSIIVIIVVVVIVVIALIIVIFYCWKKRKAAQAANTGITDINNNNYNYNNNINVNNQGQGNHDQPQSKQNFNMNMNMNNNNINVYTYNNNAQIYNGSKY